MRKTRGQGRLHYFLLEVQDGGEDMTHAIFTTSSAVESSTLQRLLFPGFLWCLKKAFRLGGERRLRISLEVVDSHMAAAIAECKKTPSDDLISRFLKKRSTDGDLQRIALNYLLAGRDTSSVALSWFFWTVMRRPDVERKLVTEITAVLLAVRGSGRAKWLAGPLEFDEMERLIYLKAALAETLRLYPSVPQDTKYVVADDVLPIGPVVPAGSSVTYSVYSMGRLETIWGRTAGSSGRRGPGVPADAVDYGGSVAAPPPGAGAGPPGAAEDVAHVVHEARATRLRAARNLDDVDVQGPAATAAGQRQRCTGARRTSTAAAAQAAASAVGSVQVGEAEASSHPLASLGNFLIVWRYQWTAATLGGGGAEAPPSRSATVDVGDGHLVDSSPKKVTTVYFGEVAGRVVSIHSATISPAKLMRSKSLSGTSRSLKPDTSSTSAIQGSDKVDEVAPILLAAWLRPDDHPSVRSSPKMELCFERESLSLRKFCPHYVAVGF
ncbi:hypothetical protein ZIOFF_012706 [Zingiber officinale]|uniref:Cytochrome P450 n=1 Tax=Zingiber officinale TaxID=94328 RepID=A0A8J5I8H3_ZINOF|nr:hypothetical protein ZIOFF_012706 [Zingiber officinale]